MKRVVVVLAMLVMIACDANAAGFAPGDVFAKATHGYLWNITAGGDFPSAARLAEVGYTDVGDMAWSADLSTLYVSNPANGTVYGVSASGTVTPFATGLTTPLGLLRTKAGRLLVAEQDSGQVTDITAGGNFTAAAPFASGLSVPIDFAQTNDGRIFVTENAASQISDITAGGVINDSHVLASQINTPWGFVTDPTGDGLMVSSPGTLSVIAIASDGTKSTFATNRQISGLAYTFDGRLLGSDYTTDSVYDITAGGNLSAAPVFATVENAVNVSVVPLPEPASLAFVAAGAITLMRRRRPLSSPRNTFA